MKSDRLETPYKDLKQGGFSSKKRALLARKLKQKGIHLPQNRPGIPKRPVASPCRLSFAQERLWFIDQLEPGTPAYNIPQVFRLTGELNAGVLERSINELIRRHESLRTTFELKDGQPLQIIAPELKLVVSVTDLSAVAENDREIEAQKLVHEAIHHPFDLAKGPLFRARLLKLNAKTHILILIMHHIISDGWSMGVLFREMATLYAAYSTGNTNLLPSLPIQYADFAIWQREWLKGNVLDRQLSYWKTKLKGVPSTLALPTDRSRSTTLSYRGGRVSFTVPKSTTKLLKQLSQKEGVTLFMMLLAVFIILLFRYSQQKDIVVGAPIANRNRSEIEGLIGFFVNTLALRTSLSGNSTVKELLSQVKETCLQAYAHQDLPFEKLAEELQLERDMSCQPLFQVIFQLFNTSYPDLELPGLTTTPVKIDSSIAKFDLNLTLTEQQNGLTGNLLYSSDLFDRATIERMAGHFKILLEGVVANPQQSIGTLPVLTDAEQQQILIEWNDTRADYPKDQCIHRLFEKQVKQTPDAIAVSFGEEQLTYRQLNEKANRLANYLRKFGIRVEMPVGICMERSLEMIIGLLGILKSGGTYVPLDPGYPQERLRFMLHDSEISILLTREEFLSNLPEYQGHLVLLDAIENQLVTEDPNNLDDAETTAENLAYVVYTSGSTGLPKGICIPHRAVNRLVFNTNYIGITPSDRIAHISNVSFDAATFEMWGALLQGAMLVIITRDVALSPREFASALQQHKISILFITTALFNQVARETPGAFAALHYVLFGGEMVDPLSVKAVLKAGAPKHLVHVYGPTENTTFSTYYPVREVPEQAATVPIGRPLSNTQLYLLDDHLQPVPVGVSGEVYLGGDGLAHGYLNRPELTRERFITNHPITQSPDHPIYKTGDIARYLPDGDIEFLGRVDHQVKVRGFRIELAEIETVLSRHPAVAQVVVIVREDTPRNKTLAAYLAFAENSSFDTRKLRDFLKQQLPDYMIPASFTFLNQLPLTPNGKIDRNALPEPDRIRPFQETSFVAPRTPTEKTLAAICLNLLNIEKIGVFDNFFELGGHSLLAVQVMARVQETFEVELPLRSLFENPTISGIAEQIDTQCWKNGAQPELHYEQGSSLVTIKRGNQNLLPIFLIPGAAAEKVNFLNYVRLLQQAGVKNPVYGLRPRDRKGERPSYTGVENIAANYLQEIYTVQPNGPYFLLGGCVGGRVVFEIARQLYEKGQSVANLILIDSLLSSKVEKLYRILPQNLVPGPLFRGVKYHLWKMQRFSHKRKVIYLIRQLRNLLAALMPETDKQRRKRYRQMAVQNYLTALINYRPKGQYPGPISLLMNENYHQSCSQTGWEQYISGHLKLHLIPGFHRMILGENVEATATELRKCLAIDGQSKQ